MMFAKLHKQFPKEPESSLKKLLSSKNPKDVQKILEKKYATIKEEKTNEEIIEEIQAQFPNFPKNEIESIYQKNFNIKFGTIEQIKEIIAIQEQSQPKSEPKIIVEPLPQEILQAEVEEEKIPFIKINVENKSLEEAEEFIKSTLNAAKQTHSTDKIKLIISSKNTVKEVFLKKREFALKYATETCGFKAELEPTNTGAILIYPNQSAVDPNLLGFLIPIVF